MKILVVSATEFEIAPWVEKYKTPDILITGVGIPATMFSLTKQLFKKKYHLVIQAGIAGIFSPAIEKGSVWVVQKDTFGDVGIYENEKFKSLFDLGFAKENEFPFTNGWLENPHKFLLNSALPLASAVTVNKITDDAAQVKLLSDKFKPVIETMEGAAMHYVCLQLKVKFLQIRSISNIVGDRNKQQWSINEAITNLNIELPKLVKYFSKL